MLFFDEMCPNSPQSNPTLYIFRLALTSFAVSLNVVVIISIPFLSVLLSSVSPTVLTVIVEFPSTKPRDETADFSWLKFDVRRNRNRGLDFFIVFLTFIWESEEMREKLMEFQSFWNYFCMHETIIVRNDAHNHNKMKDFILKISLPEEFGKNSGK